MPDELQTERPPVLQYGTSTKGKPWSMERKLAAAGMLFLAAALGMQFFSIFSFALPVMATFAVIGALLLSTAAIGLPAWKLLFGRRQTEQEFEAEYQVTRSRKLELLELANKTYANGPIGNWRWTMMKPSMVYGLPPQVQAYRQLTLTNDGRGRYKWECLERPVSAGETGFEFKIDRPHVILVRLTTLPCPEWIPVRFGFETHGQSEDDADLVLWFDSDNPLSADLANHWPFNDQYDRSSI